jgi:hypothetical protein
MGGLRPPVVLGGSLSYIVLGIGGLVLLGIIAAVAVLLVTLLKR